MSGRTKFFRLAAAIIITYLAGCAVFWDPYAPLVLVIGGLVLLWSERRE